MKNVVVKLILCDIFFCVFYNAIKEIKMEYKRRKYKLTDIILIAAESMLIFAAIIFSYITTEIDGLMKYRDDSGYKYNDSIYIHFSPKYHYAQYEGEEVIIDGMTDKIAGGEAEAIMVADEEDWKGLFDYFLDEVEGYKDGEIYISGRFDVDSIVDVLEIRIYFADELKDDFVRNNKNTVKGGVYVSSILDRVIDTEDGIEYLDMLNRRFPVNGHYSVSAWDEEGKVSVIWNELDDVTKKDVTNYLYDGFIRNKLKITICSDNEVVGAAELFIKDIEQHSDKFFLDNRYRDLNEGGDDAAYGSAYGGSEFVFTGRIVKYVALIFSIMIIMVVIYIWLCHRIKEIAIRYIVGQSRVSIALSMLKEYFKMMMYAILPAIILSGIYFVMGPEFKIGIFGSYKFYLVFLSCTMTLGAFVFLGIYDMLKYMKLNDSIKGE